MQSTAAEAHLVEHLVGILRNPEGERAHPPRILNVGAGRNPSIEQQLAAAECRFVCDRADVEPCEIDHPSVDRCFRCAAEDMSPIPSETYAAAFANFVLEHVPDIDRAAHEIHRILKPSCRFVTSVSNPSSPVALVTRHTPLWLHRVIRGDEAWETHFAYGSVDELVETFESAGLSRVEVTFHSGIESYLPQPLLKQLARGYDRTATALGIRSLMNLACLVFEKIH